MQEDRSLSSWRALAVRPLLEGLNFVPALLTDFCFALCLLSVLGELCLVRWRQGECQPHLQAEEEEMFGESDHE